MRTGPQPMQPCTVTDLTAFFSRFLSFLSLSLFALNVVWYLYSGLLMYCWHVCSFWHKVQFILLVNVCSIKCSLDLYSSICSVMLLLCTTTWKEKCLFTRRNLYKPWIKSQLTWFFFFACPFTYVFKRYFHYLIRFCNVFFCFDFQPLLQHLISQGAVSLACAANFFNRFFF